MQRPLIIGYGNPLRGDDGLGWHAAAQLAERITNDEADIIACHQLTYELAEPISRAALAIFIDASTELLPGQVETRAVAQAAMLPFTHDIDAATLLTYARELYGASPPALMIAAGGESFAHSEQLSITMAAALSFVTEITLTRLRAFRSEAQCDSAIAG